MKDRFAKLAALTKGAALLAVGGASIAGAGCTKNEAPPPAAAAGSIQPDPAAADPGDASYALPRRRFPILNAVHPGRGWRTDDAGGTTDGGTNDGS